MNDAKVKVKRFLSAFFPRFPAIYESEDIGLERLANACTGLWRELFTRACFLVGLGRKQGD